MCEEAQKKTSDPEEDVFISKIHARPINEKYLLIRKIGEGGHGAVYIGKDINSEEEVALKLEHHSIDPSILALEADFYQHFQGCTGFPRLYWYDWHDDYKVMAFELLGPSLEDLFQFCERRFSLKTGLMLMDQLLQRLEDVHVRNILHRDIKPSNCLLGSGLNGNVVYLTDFGIADYVTRWGDRDPSPTRPHLIGTARFASIRGHQGRLQSAKDDLESLGYMIVYFLQGRLPWLRLQASKRDQNTVVMEKKQTIVAEELCKELPVEFAKYISKVRSLRHRETPDYAEMRQSFRSLAEEKGICYDNVFDWTIRRYMEQAGEAE